MIKSRDELLNAIRERIGEEPDDDGVALLEDITDTLNDLENKTQEDWKTKYEENDKAWRKKYTDRFYTNKEPDTNDDDEFEDEEPVTFEDLFSKGEK